MPERPRHASTGAPCGSRNPKVFAWLQGECERLGLRPVLAAACESGVDITSVLRDCLTLTTAWAYVGWRKQRRGLVSDLDITQFFEWHALAHIPLQFRRHMTALAHEFDMTWGAVLTGEGASLWDSEDDHEP